MQNEFEKQVQQKMEELKLVPSEPVWQKIEMQIHKKKDRRRVVFWILLSALLLGGGLWLGTDQYSNNVAIRKNDVEKTNHPLPKQNASSQPEQSIINHAVNESQKKNPNKPSSVQPEKKFSLETTVTNEHISFHSTAIEKKSTQKNKTQKENSFTKQNRQSSPKNDETVLREASIKNSEDLIARVKKGQQTEQKLNPPDSGLTNTHAYLEVDSSVKDEVTVETSLLKTDSIKNDSVSIKQVRTKKYTASKWSAAFTVSAGLSGTGRLNAFSGLFGDGQKSLQPSPNYSSGSPGGGSQVYYGPSDVSSKFSFAAGLVLQKQVGKRKSFFTGLRYNYYSNSILVGSKVNQNIIVRDYAVSQYYSNNFSGNGITTSQPYTNRYHFISIPIAIDWQLLKKRPLNLYTGLSFQYLLQTNGLVFDYSRQAYFHSIKAFNRVQLFSELGLNYSFSLKRNAIRIGPGLQYGLSRLEKDNSEHHLFMYGLKAQLQFNRK